MKIRPMTMEDADKMLEWKNYPETRKFAIVSHKKILKKNHLKWLAENLKYFKIIGNQFGAIRIQDKEISIWIDRKHWGKKIATKVIRQVSKKGFTAKIVEGHIASMRCFIKCGYLPTSYKDNHYVFQKR